MLKPLFSIKRNFQRNSFVDLYFPFVFSFLFFSPSGKGHIAFWLVVVKFQLKKLLGGGLDLVVCYIVDILQVETLASIMEYNNKTGGPHKGGWTIFTNGGNPVP